MIGFLSCLSPSVVLLACMCWCHRRNEETFWLFGDARRQPTLNAGSIESSGGSQSAGELSKNKWDTFVTSQMWRRRSPLTCKRAIISCCFKCYVLFRPLSERERASRMKNKQQNAHLNGETGKNCIWRQPPMLVFFFSFWDCCKKKNKNKKSRRRIVSPKEDDE